MFAAAIVAVFVGAALARPATAAQMEQFARDLARRMELRAQGVELPNRVVVQPDEASPLGDVPCATMPVYDFHTRYFGAANKTSAASKCPIEDSCDDAAFRDKTPTTTVQVRTAWTVWNKQMTSKALNDAIAEFQKLFAADNVQIVVDAVNFVDDTTYGTCLPAYSDNDYWYDVLMTLKQKYAVTPDQALNVFVGCQDRGYSGTLLGIATFPWDPIALTSFGGLWMNAAAMFPDDATLRHETGHCFGLWHVFHSEELAACQPNAASCGVCCERPHALSGHTSAPSNAVGDFCSDTMAQPRHWQCAQPAGAACDGVAWTTHGPTDYENVMSYAMVDPNTMKEEHCQTGFSPQQERRVHCYLRGLLSGWLV